MEKGEKAKRELEEYREAVRDGERLSFKEVVHVLRKNGCGAGADQLEYGYHGQGDLQCRH